MQGDPRGETILTVPPFDVVCMVLNRDKVARLWDLMQTFPTLFSDLTRRDPDNFVRALTAPNSMWYEIWEADSVVGLAWMTDLEQVIDANVHIAYFDRQLKAKDHVTRSLMHYAFKVLPVQRLTAMLPELYFNTVKMLERIGFTLEGRKRQAALMGSRWNDVLIYGLTRPEVEATWDSSEAPSNSQEPLLKSSR